MTSTIINQAALLVCGLALELSRSTDPERRALANAALVRANNRLQRRISNQRSVTKLAFEVVRATERRENLAEYSTKELQVVRDSVRHMAAVESRHGNQAAFWKFDIACQAIDRALKKRTIPDLRQAYEAKRSH